jgi:NADPH:quinone reductase-like Zn-dependent oxidoreductase
MKAAVIAKPGIVPAYGDFEEPVAQPGQEIIAVKAAALTHLTKSRASGEHYSSEHVYPAIAGVDGVGQTAGGRRVYFALPVPPFGAMAEKTPVRASQCVPVPDNLDDVSAAALANPGMSCWAAFAARAQLKRGEAVLVNGATGAAGRLAVQIAKYMGAGRVIAAGRGREALESLKSIGADGIIPFNLTPGHPESAQELEAALEPEFSAGVDVVIDYLWGPSAAIILTAAAKAGRDAVPMRFVQVGSISGDNIRLPSAALRSSSTVMMGSGINSVSMEGLLDAIEKVFHAARPAKLQVNTKTVPLSEVEKTWNADTGSSRVVLVIN